MISHDAMALTGFALVICVLGAFATSVLGRQAFTTRAPVIRLRWMVLGVVAATCTIWADSFVAIVVSRSAVPSGFEPFTVALSFVVGFVLVGLGAHVTLGGRSLVTPAVGGALTGAAIPAIHFLGMHALRVAGTVAWDGIAAAVSVAVGVLFSMAAAMTWLRSRSRSPLLPIALFTFAICGAHAIAIGAVTIRPDARVVLPAGLIGDAALARIVGTAIALVVVLTLMAQAMNRQSRRRSEEERRQLQQLAEIAVEGLVICEGSRIVWANRSFETIVPGARENRIGTPIESLLMIASIVALPHDREFDAQLRTGEGDDHALVPVRVITRAVQMAERPQIVVAIRDQRARLRAEAEMERLANSDALTGLANRTRFNRVLQDRFARPVGPSDGFALLSLDLDRFKSVNDTYGHAAGDSVLVEVAARLAALVREGDLVARLGGDEFAILAFTGRDVAAVTTLAADAIATISEPFSIDGRSHQIGVSVGVAFAWSDGDDPEALTRSADLALYRAKADGRGIHRLFEVGMRLRMQERHGLEQAMRAAVVHGEFRLHFQPQVDARTGLFNGAEALVRWQHPVRGLIAPADFIGIAEDINLILPLGEWVLRTACREAACWPDPLVVAVNLSPIQFRDPALVATVAAALAWSGLPGRRLELEITENVLIEDTARVKAVLDDLKALGIRLSLDDFGTGYASLGHLHRFPFDKIKVDRSFVQGLPGDAGSGAIVHAIVALAAGLGMHTTAEGVEDAAQRGFVTAAGCDQIQGWLFGRPVVAAALPDAFRAADLSLIEQPVGVRPSSVPTAA